MQQAQYLQTIVCACAPENRFAQDAIEWAVICGHVTLTYLHAGQDVITVMGEYDRILAAYRHARAVADPLTEQLQHAFGLPITELTSGDQQAA